MLRFLRAYASVAVMVTFASVAYAEAPAAKTSSLSWIRLEGADSCVSTQELARDVEGYLARSVFVSASQADVSVEGHIAKAGQGFRAEITIRDAKGTLLGTRDLVRADAPCSAMREPLALIIAIMIDPDAQLKEPKEAPAKPKAEPPKKKPASAEWRVDAMGSVVGSVGLLPNFGVGAMASSIISPPNVPVAFAGSGAFWFDNTVKVGGGEMTFSLLTLAGSLCPLALHWDRVHTYGCVGGQLGMLRARAAGFTNPTPESSRVFLGGTADLRLAVRLFGPFAARVGISLVVPILRDQFTYKSGKDEIVGFQMSPVAAMGDVGVGIVFP